MKTKLLYWHKISWKTLSVLALLAILIAILLLSVAYAAPDSSYILDWWTVDAGGGSSAAGNYQLSGGIAQPDAGSLSGGNYQLQGGFWQGNTYFLHLPIVVR